MHHMVQWPRKHRRIRIQSAAQSSLRFRLRTPVIRPPARYTCFGRVQPNYVPWRAALRRHSKLEHAIRLKMLALFRACLAMARIKTYGFRLKTSPEHR
jgi:hypothetical protein